MCGMGADQFFSWTYIRVFWRRPQQVREGLTCICSVTSTNAINKSALVEENRKLQGVVVAALQVSAKTYANAMNGWDTASVAVKRGRNLEFAYYGNTRHSNTKGGAGLGWKHLLLEQRELCTAVGC